MASVAVHRPDGMLSIGAAGMVVHPKGGIGQHNTKLVLHPDLDPTRLAFRLETPNRDLTDILLSSQVARSRWPGLKVTMAKIGAGAAVGTVAGGAGGMAGGGAIGLVIGGCVAGPAGAVVGGVLGSAMAAPGGAMVGAVQGVCKGAAAGSVKEAAVDGGKSAAKVASMHLVS
mmetsp:Transcript_53660/g.116691  ORF Transcript_53660/g.116691 Transcript_53660/m.116691 type:complete len:172 (+) Transcript_53660:1-516(+)